MKTPDLTSENIKNYDTAWSADEYTREDGLRPWEAELIGQHFPKPPATVLDLGCGAGRTTNGLQKLGYTTTAIDLSESLLNHARTRYPHLDFRLMDATKLEFSECQLDAALFSFNGIDCIYPVSGRIKCMQEVHRVLKPGGIFILSSHNLVGSIFSGGYFYPTGYWNALKLLASQVGNPVAREWYIRFIDGGGAQNLYAAPPKRTAGQLQQCGFEVVLIRGIRGETDMKKLRMHEQHIHFVARKK